MSGGDARILLSLLTPEKSLRNKGTSLSGVFHLKDKERKTGKTHEEISLDEKKGEMKMNEDEKG